MNTFLPSWRYQITRLRSQIHKIWSQENDGKVPLEDRKKLAWKAFSHTASYDAAISSWLSLAVSPADELPATVHIAAEKVETLRYGENPHQQGKYPPTYYPYPHILTHYGT